MRKGIFVGYYDYGFNYRGKPVIAFSNEHDALKWKLGEPYRDFTFIEWEK